MYGHWFYHSTMHIQGIEFSLGGWQQVIPPHTQMYFEINFNLFFQSKADYGVGVKGCVIETEIYEKSVLNFALYSVLSVAYVWTPAR